MELISTQGSVLKWQDDDSDFPVPCLNIPANNNDSCVNQELQNLFKMFTSWLQPETHSKEQIISQLVMEQFLKTAHCKDKIAVKKKWDTSGKNMRRFMQEITDECLKPPEMIHVSMHGEEGLFPGHTTLNEVINILNGMKSSTTSARTDLRIPLNILSPTRECEEVEQRSVVGQKPLLMPTFMDCPFSTGHEDSEDGYNNPMNLSKVNRRERSPGIEMDSISIIQTHRCLQTEEKDVSDVIPQDYRSSNQLTSMYHGFSQREASFEVVPKEEVQQDIMVPVEQLQSEMITRPQQNEDCQNSERDYTCESHQERQNRVPKTYQCEECPRTFKCPSSLLSHQRRHKKERTFVCNTCHKDFYNKSDLNVHSVIHKGKKPFACNTCGQSFSHKTNLIAHERIHTGEKPYTCSLCNHSFRQSSTYHRHRSLCHKSE